MSQGNKPLPKITKDTLFEMDDANKKMLEYLRGHFKICIEDIVEAEQ